MSDSPSFHVVVDVSRNVLHMRLTGTVTVAHMQAAVLNIEGVMGQIQAGFVAVTDLSGLVEMEIECGPHVGRMMDLFRDRQVGKVVRLIPDPHKDIGFNILSATHYRGRVQIITCTTAAELARALA